MRAQPSKVGRIEHAERQELRVPFEIVVVQGVIRVAGRGAVVVPLGQENQVDIRLDVNAATARPAARRWCLAAATARPAARRWCRRCRGRAIVLIGDVLLDLHVTLPAHPCHDLLLAAAKLEAGHSGQIRLLEEQLDQVLHLRGRVELLELIRQSSHC